MKTGCSRCGPQKTFALNTGPCRHDIAQLVLNKDPVQKWMRAMRKTVVGYQAHETVMIDFYLSDATFCGEAVSFLYEKID